MDGGLEQVRRSCMVSAGRSVFWRPLMGAESDSAGDMYGGSVSFSDATGHMSKIRMQFCGKVALRGVPSTLSGSVGCKRMSTNQLSSFHAGCN